MLRSLVGSEMCIRDRPRLAIPRIITSVGELHPEMAEGTLWICCGWGAPGAERYLPNSVYVDLEHTEEWPTPITREACMQHGPKTGLIHAPERLKDRLQALGIRVDRRCVVYTVDSDTVDMQLVMACSLVWLLLFCGVEQVNLLDGGIAAWEEAGRPTVPDLVAPTPVDEFGGDAFPGRPEVRATTEMVEMVVGRHLQTHRLVDVRSWSEYTGFSHDYCYMDPEGGAVSYTHLTLPTKRIV
eukprot:TRINITY_DN5839_c0_g1_i1.p1 TRINITY_DN5839_c0_g1~~TRINITY_DN5839_c0_g1_i1.p1  ORF type:complete len:268 (+),score=73.85 TRINITY_DN5839_c0_g1_i1:83-805(+)